MKPYQRKNGAVCFDFTDHNGKHRVFYMGGRYSLDDAASLRQLVLNLVSARKLAKEPNLSDAERLKNLSFDFRTKLERWDVIDKAVETNVITIGELCKRFLETQEKRDVRENTLRNDRQGVKKFLTYFDASRLVTSITPAEAKELRGRMSKRNSVPTVNREIKRFKSIFKYALENRYIKENPFATVEGGQSVNPERMEYVRKDYFLDILDRFAENQEERMIFILARFAGLRMPSEINNMKISDIGEKSIKIAKETKTGAREVPITDVIREELDRYLPTVPENSIYLFPNLRNTPNIGSLFRGKLMKGGVKPWKKIFQNLRSSCQTDWRDKGIQEYLISYWSGNKESTRNLHYYQIKEETLASGYDIVRNDSPKSEDVSGAKNQSTVQDFEKVLVDLAVKFNEPQQTIIKHWSDYLMEKSKKFGQGIEEFGRLIDGILEAFPSYLIGLTQGKKQLCADGIDAKTMAEYEKVLGIKNAAEALKYLGGVLKLDDENLPNSLDFPVPVPQRGLELPSSVFIISKKRSLDNA